MIDKTIYIEMYFSNAQKVDVSVTSETPVNITLSKELKLTAERRGEIYWNNSSNESNAVLCFQSRHSCASCLPESWMDGFGWDLADDGMGNPKNTKSLLLSHETLPLVWSGADEKTADCIKKNADNLICTSKNGKHGN
jgi:hypothetical protein